MTQQQSSASIGGTGAGAGKYFLLGFLVILNILNFVDRQLIASFANDIVEDLSLSNTQFALITGFAFTVFYSVAGLLVGSLVDTGNRPKLLALGLFFWSFFTALTGAARSFVEMALPRMVIGVGESIQTPSSISMLSERFAQNQMAFASGIYYTGVPIGVGISLLIVGLLGPEIGWRNCFYLMGVIGLCMVGILLLIRETPDRIEQIAARKASAESRWTEIKKLAGDLRVELVANPALLLTIAGGVVLHFVLGAAVFDQLWLVQELGFDRSWIALRTGLIFLVAGSLGNIFGGLCSDWVLKHTRFTRPLFLAALMLALAPITVFYRLAGPEDWLLWVGISCAAFTLGAFYGPTFATVQELAPRQSRGTAIALYILLLNLVGLGLGGLMCGISIDVMQSLHVAKPYTWTLFWLNGLSTLCIPLFYWAHKSYGMKK
ncbi:MAG: MFS transporter [Gammaproteobacteria bacterium]